MRRPRGLLVPAAAVALAALAGTALPGAVGPALVVAALLVVPAVVLARRRGDRAALLAATSVLVVAAVLASVAVHGARRSPEAVPVGRAVAVVLRVGEVRALGPAHGSGPPSVRHLLRGELRAVVGRRETLAVPVVLFGSRVGAAVPGSVVRARVLLRPSAPTDAAAFVGELLGRPVPLEPPPPGEAVAADLRRRFAASTERLPGDGGALLPGLAIGDTTRVGPELEQAMGDSSLAHLTAVSGANCAVVIVLVLALGGLLRLPRTMRIAAAGLALAAFVVLVTPQPSVVRAAVMTTVGLACVLVGRRTTGPPALALTVVVLLLVDPWAAWSAGFVLSVAATAGLLLLAPPLAERLGRLLPRRMALVLAVPIAAQAACQPVLVLLQPGIPVFGVLANLLAEPAAPVATVLGLLACLIGAVVPPLGAGIALLAWLPAAWIGLVARGIAGLPQLGWPAGVLGAALAAGLLALGLLAVGRRFPPPLRAAGALGVTVALLVVAGVAAGAVVGRTVGTPRDWTFAACDVGQGDALVLNGGGRFAVVDTGPDPLLMLRCLDRLGVRRIDLLVLTHWDADHVGGARAVLPRVRTVLVGPIDGAAARRLRRELAAETVVRQARRGDAVRLGRLRLEVLWPPAEPGVAEPGNAASIVLLVTGGPRLLLTGDLGEEAQDAVLAAGSLPRVDVLKVAHHGSGDQSPGFTRTTGAVLGVISVGAGNDYGHPAGRFLSILRGAGVRPVRTDQSGLVLIGRRAGRVSLWTERPVTDAVWTPAK